MPKLTIRGGNSGRSHAIRQTQPERRQLFRPSEPVMHLSRCNSTSEYSTLLSKFRGNFSSTLLPVFVGEAIL
jgi:hypothetical protein